MRRTAAAVLLVVSCSVATDTHVLSLGFSQGHQSHYSFHLTSTQTIDMHGVLQTTSVDMRATATQTVESVGADGIADVTLMLSNVRVTTTVDGQRLETVLDSAVPYQAVRIAPDARLLTVNRLGTAPTSPLGVAGYAGAPVWAVLPNDAVKVGASWSKSYKQAVPPGTGVISIRSTSTYLRDETVDGTTAAVVHATSNASLDIAIDSAKLPSTTYIQPPRSQVGVAGVIEQTITLVTNTRIEASTTGEVTTWIDVAGHRVIKTEMTSAITGTMVLVVAPVAALAGTEGPYIINGSQKLTVEAT